MYASNFTGLNLPGVQILDDPRQWQDLPAGSVLFVDEAQRFWRSRRSGEPAPEVIAMETQRHDGVSMVLLTQQPTYLDKHVRGLVDVHRHLIRRAGLEASQVYEWERCKDEPETPANMELADTRIWVFPKKFFGSYTSAEVHTVKRRFPLKLKLVAVAVVAVMGMLWWAANSLKPDAKKDSETSAVSAEGDTPESRATSRRSGGYANAQAYLAAHQPRIPAFPGSAPIFDDRKVQSEPELFCMSVGQDGKDSCSCMTEQGSRYHLDELECQYIARHGAPYNPYKRPDRDSRETQQSTDRTRGAGDSPAAMASNDAASSPNTAIEGEQVSGYGDLGPRDITAAP